MDTFNHQHRAAVISSSFHQPILNQYPANDFVEITARKMSQNVNDFNLNYHPAYSEEEKQHEENLRRSSVNATNNFTFNQSITHVNLINNRYHFDLPPPQPFTNHDTLISICTYHHRRTLTRIICFSSKILLTEDTSTTQKTWKIHTTLLQR